MNIRLTVVADINGVGRKPRGIFAQAKNLSNRSWVADIDWPIEGLPRTGDYLDFSSFGCSVQSVTWFAPLPYNHDRGQAAQIVLVPTGPYMSGQELDSRLSHAGFEVEFEVSR